MCVCVKQIDSQTQREREREGQVSAGTESSRFSNPPQKRVNSDKKSESKVLIFLAGTLLTTSKYVPGEILPKAYLGSLNRVKNDLI